MEMLNDSAIMLLSSHNGFQRSQRPISRAMPKLESDWIEKVMPMSRFMAMFEYALNDAKYIDRKNHSEAEDAIGFSSSLDVFSISSKNKKLPNTNRQRQCVVVWCKMQVQN